MTKFRLLKNNPKVYKIEDINLNELNKEGYTQFTTLKGKGKALLRDFIPISLLTILSLYPLLIPTLRIKAIRTRSLGR